MIYPAHAISYPAAHQFSKQYTWGPTKVLLFKYKEGSLKKVIASRLCCWLLWEQYYVTISILVYLTVL